MSAVARPRIVVLDAHTTAGDAPLLERLGVHGELVLHARTDPSEIGARAAGAAILVTNKTKLDGQTLRGLADLRFVALLSTGTDVVDLAAARQLGIAVANVPDYAAAAVAQHTLALILELADGVGRHSAAVARGDWCRAADFCFWESPVVELEGRTLGLVGMGVIGRRVAALGLALGMKVAAFSPSMRGGPDHASFAWSDLDRLVAGCDVLSLHCPANERTRGLMDAGRLAQMKSGAFLVNTARGALVDEVALVARLRSGELAGAALDVIAEEPMRADSPLLGAPNLIVTPHMAWSSIDARRRLVAEVDANIAAFLRGEDRNLV